ncbi:RDD family protein [Neisseria weixii]|uniref:RDD family protein n=1 Tax=Neisseria weixii TaxID=1853276 RepID=A0A3N4NFK9_9NEIS|nr:RDD family protein [Neisseria weixii]ATD65822.1 RDD family protein [Neisseria weixii]RPD90920.1 RDD family protein [Neisseria weixii]RPD91114.1 RDD family protein [Neisseria weixii]
MNDMNLMLSEMTEPQFEVDLAPPMKRIGAVIINSVLNIAAYIPLIISVLAGESGYLQRVSASKEMTLPEINMTWLMIGIAVLVVYGAVQIYFMSKDGQSLGKKMLGIRVLKTNGSNPGFFGTVFMREVAYYFLLGLAAGVIAYVAQSITGNPDMFDLLSNLIQLAAYVACVVMLFKVKSDRRTLQDYLANTVVVELPKR